MSRKIRNAGLALLTVGLMASGAAIAEAQQQGMGGMGGMSGTEGAPAAPAPAPAEQK